MSKHLISKEVVGKKKSSSGSGDISSQFVRQITCPVLFIPENAKVAMNKILVPIDFYENSGHALQQGIDMRPYFNYPRIICLNVYFTAPDNYGTHEAGL